MCHDCVIVYIVYNVGVSNRVHHSHESVGKRGGGAHVLTRLVGAIRGGADLLGGFALHCLVGFVLWFVERIGHFGVVQRAVADVSWAVFRVFRRGVNGIVVAGIRNMGSTVGVVE